MKWSHVCKVGSKSSAGIRHWIIAGLPRLWCKNPSHSELLWILPTLVCHQENSMDPTLDLLLLSEPRCPVDAWTGLTMHPTPTPRLLTIGPPCIGLGKPPSFKMGIYLGCNSDFNLWLYHGLATKQCSGLLISYALESLKLLVHMYGNKFSWNELQAVIQDIFNTRVK